MIRALQNCRRFATNTTPKEAKYCFEAVSVQKIHPIRTLAGGTDRLLLTPNLLVLADHGGQTLAKHSVNLDDTFSNKLLTVLGYFFGQETNRYCDNVYELVQSAVEHSREEGSCSLTVAAMHPDTGDISFYYIGDSLYGFFHKDRVEVVEGLYQEFNRAKQVGYNTDYSPDSGYVETYPREAVHPDDLLVIASNGLWNNVHLDILHYELRGRGSFQSQPAGAVGEQQLRSLSEMAERVGKVAQLCSRKGNYESPVFKRAQAQDIEYPKEGILDDISVILARRKRTLVVKQEPETAQLE